MLDAARAVVNAWENKDTTMLDKAIKRLEQEIIKLEKEIDKIFNGRRDNLKF